MDEEYEQITEEELASFISENEIMFKERIITPEYESEKKDLVLSNLGKKELYQLHLLSLLIDITKDIDEFKEAHDFFISEKALIINASRAYKGKTLDTLLGGKKKIITTEYGTKESRGRFPWIK